jgi:hypothetical protein
MNMLKVKPHTDSIIYFNLLATVFLIVVWSVVFLRTLKGVSSGKIFLPAH